MAVPTTLGQFYQNAGIAGAGNRTTVGGAVLASPQTPKSSPAVTTPVNKSAPAASPSAVLGASTNSGNTFPQQSTPPAPDTSALNQVYQDALNGIDATISQFQNELPQTYSTIDTDVTAQKGKITNQLADINSQYDTQALSNKQQETAIENQQRQDAAEIMQGIQSRYGGTTGTGAFASELLGRQVLQNINQNKQALAKAIFSIDQGKVQAQRDANQQFLDIDNQASQLKLQAKQKLDEVLASLNSQKGQLGVARQSALMDVLQNYRNVVSQIEANNTAAKQQLFRDQQTFDQQVALKKIEVANAALNNSHLTTSQLINLANSGTLSDQGLRETEQTLGLGSLSLKQPPSNNLTSQFSAAVNTQPTESNSTAQPNQSTGNDLLKGVYNFFGL